MKTAVEWLEEGIKTSNKDTFYDLVEVISMAKAMEEKQIKDAWLSAWKDSMLNPLSDECYQELADEYYKQKYDDDN